MTDADYIKWLETECGYFAPCETGDGRWTAISNFIFTSAILIGDMFDMYGHTDRWCYHKRIDALSARLVWACAGYKGEPPGWHRHPESGRRRENGDPDTEIIQH